MFVFEQSVHNLIGTPQAIEELSKKEHARVLVCSDSHGHPEILDSIITRYGKDCDGFIFCGDGAGDLAYVISKAMEDKNYAQMLPPVIAAARGNGDPGSYPINSGLSISIPSSQYFTVNNRNLMVVHGHREGVDFGIENYGLEMQINECSVGFYGHTHIAKEETSGGYKFVNPGSCARPRGGQPPCFAIATVEKNFVDMSYIKLNSLVPGENQFQRWIPIY